MKITPVEHKVDLIEASEGRTEGLHVSDLYNAFYKATDPKRYGKDPDLLTPEFMAVGLAWEQYLEKRLLASGINAQRPGEFTIYVGERPVYFSPDLYIANGHERGGEIKATWMSLSENFDEPKFNKYHTQAKTYGHHLHIPDWTFYVLFIRGDYKASFGPQLRAFNVSYTEREMAEEWDMLCSFGRNRKML